MPYNVYPDNNFKLTKPVFKDKTKCLFFFKNLKKNGKSFLISNKTKSIADNLNRNSYYVNNFINFLKKEYPHHMRSELKKNDSNQNLFSNKLMKLFSKIKSFLVKRCLTSNYSQTLPISKEARKKV